MRNNPGDACNICIRAGLYILKNDSALFPKIGSAYHDPNNNFIARTLKGFISGDGRAPDIKADFDDLPSNNELYARFEEIPKTESETWQDYFIRLQQRADNSEIIVGVMLTSSGASGHVMMITKGGCITITKKTENWGESYTREDRGITLVPSVLECGQGERKTEAPLCLNVDYTGATERLKWYKYKK